MSHEKVYGICENKCRHEVYRKDAADETFLSKAEAAASYAPKSHAVSKPTYGIATPNLYGHVQLTGDLNVPEQATTGRALAAYAGKVLNDKINVANSRAEEIDDRIDRVINGINHTFATIGDLEELEQQLSRLSDRVSALEGNA